MKTHSLFICRNMLSEAEKKVWGCPELLESLLLFLDPDSLICLAKAHEPTSSVLGKSVWSKLIKQVCHRLPSTNTNNNCGARGYKEFMLRRMEVVYNQKFSFNINCFKCLFLVVLLSLKISLRKIFNIESMQFF